ncbi:tetratricopeptide repeat protein [Bizionia sp. M204]|uniref:tetratricopeptide repeat protein n=1 Tax=Bizionia sp. M204 TaxID=2675331 RepID=UPI002057DA27|nr:tetratricopeptide repeat protein [Bizionia sp. M204]UPS90780.1 tetratricopeptide repeat protein [Bizionia sp. M204]
MRCVVLFICCFFQIVTFAQGKRGAIGESTESKNIGKKHALIIGISDYQEDKLKLNYAHNDALLFNDYLKRVENVPEENMVLLTNEDAVAINILRELKKLLNTVETDDTVYIYFAGHGDVVDDFGEKAGFLLAADANANQEYYAGGSIPLALLNNRVIGNITNKNAQVILILDACRSGFIFEEGTQKNLGTIQAMFENATKILSCGPNELSYEDSAIKHGYFTYYLVKGLMGNADTNTDNNVIYREIDDYLYENVYNTVSKKYSQNQTPVVRTSNDRAVFKAINPNNPVLAFEVVESELSKIEGYASRGSVNLNTEKASEILAFSKAIQAKNYYGRPSSALELYKKAKASKSVSEKVLESMQYKLIKELSASAQKLINQYISGDTKLPSSREFSKQAQHLEICLELMDHDDFFREQIQVNQLVLDAYAIIRSKNFPAYSIAKRKLKSAVTMQPRGAYIHNALGLVYNSEAVYDSAHYHFKEANKLIGTWSNPVNNLGENLLDQYKYDDAKQFFDTSLGLKGSNTEANLRLGDLNVSQGKYQQAEVYYKTILKTHPNHAIALQKLSALEKLKGNAALSVDYHNQAIQADSINTITEYGLFNYIQDHDLNPKTAETLLLNAIDRNPDDASSYTDYADYLRVNNRKRTRLLLADSLYKIAINKNPLHAWTYAGHGWLLRNLRQPAEAKLSFETGISKNPNNAKAYYYYGNYLNEGIKDPRNAEINYLKAVEKNPYYLPAYSKLINLYNEQNQQEKSIKLLNTLLAKNAQIPDVYNLLGQTYVSNGAFTKAIEAYKQALRIDGSYSNGYTNLGYSELQMNQFDDAKEHYLKATVSDPFKNKKSDIATFMLTTARNKLKFGTPAEAKELFRLASEINPSTETELAYSEFLYLHNEPELAFNNSEKTLKLCETKTDQISVLEILVKTGIDASKTQEVDSYFGQLMNLNSNPDLLLASVYFAFKGDRNKSYALKSKTNPMLLRSNKLKELYSGSTIRNYILGN